jgi:hypothetical protein
MIRVYFGLMPLLCFFNFFYQLALEQTENTVRCESKTKDNVFVQIHIAVQQQPMPNRVKEVGGPVFGCNPAIFALPFLFFFFVQPSSIFANVSCGGSCRSVYLVIVPLQQQCVARGDGGAKCVGLHPGYVALGIFRRTILTS